MSAITVVAFYFIVWWLTLFAVLPVGVKTHEETDDVTLGTVSSAPSKPMLLKKMLATTIISAVIMAVVYWAVAIQGVTWADVPLIPDFSAT